MGGQLLSLGDIRQQRSYVCDVVAKQNGERGRTQIQVSGTVQSGLWIEIQVSGTVQSGCGLRCRCLGLCSGDVD